VLLKVLYLQKFNTKIILIRIYLTLILFPLFLKSYSQDIVTEETFTVNARNASTVKVFDYYTKGTFKFIYDSTYTSTLMGNFQRDNGIVYCSYSTSIDSKYAKIEYLRNTWKHIEYFNGSLFYPIYHSYLSIGYSLLVSRNNSQNTWLNSVLIRSKNRFYSIEIDFLNKLNKLAIEFDPMYKITKDNMYIGIEANLLVIDNKYKWNLGFTVKHVLHKIKKEKQN
jgi:hypothetical protein